MKKSLLLLAVSFLTLSLSAKKVKFAVDMTGQITSTLGVHVVGDFQEAAGYALNWDPASVTLTQEGSTNIYSIIVTIPAFTKYEYHFVNGDQTYESEFVPDESRVGYNFDDNRWLYVDSLANDTTFVGAILFSGNAPAGLSLVRYKVDMTSAILPSINGVHVGSSNDGYSSTKVRMYTFGDSIYEIINYYPTNTIYNFRYFNGNTLGNSEVVSGSCATSGNRDLTLPKDSVLPIVCFASCSACVATSVKEIQQQIQSFVAYPNPTKNNLTILSNENQIIESIVIMSVTGQEVKHIDNINQSYYTIADLQISAGLYTIKVSNNNSQMQCLKLIVE